MNASIGRELPDMRKNVTIGSHVRHYGLYTQRWIQKNIYKYIENSLHLPIIISALLYLAIASNVMCAWI